MILGLDPEVDDFDASSDTDRDGLSDLLELLLGTDPFVDDSDGDGFMDGEESLFLSDFLNPASIPIRLASTTTPIVVFNPVLDGTAHQNVVIHNAAAPESVAGRKEPEVIGVQNDEEP